MKMVKSLLLGSAAGFVAVAGAQAADLPVKAKAVEYVKICSLYGVGYYYIPGTDTCIKIGGYVRYEAYHNYGGGNASYPTVGSSAIPQGAVQNRQASTFGMQARFRLTADVRTQTEYGTLRSYFSSGVNYLNFPNEPLAGAANWTLALERAFIQFAGFTFGRADSFFAFYNGAAYGFVPMQLDGSSGPAGLNVAAYTWQFGNGLSATVSLEDGNASMKGVIDLNAAGLLGGGIGQQNAIDTKGAAVPNIVANLRVDQAWGSAQIMGGLHQVAGRYYTAFPAGACGGAAFNNTTACGYPGDEWGWAVGAGLTLKMPWDAKDTLSGVIAYSEGAPGFVAFGGNNAGLWKGDGIAAGSVNEGVFMNGTGIELTQVWGGTVAFEHYWTPSLRTSWVFGYMDVSYTDAAKAMLTTRGLANCAGAGMVVTSCNPDWSQWRLASRTMWNPVANLDLGIEVAYSKINTAFGGTGTFAAAQAGMAPGTYSVADQSIWTATFRAQRSFWP